MPQAAMERTEFEKELSQLRDASEHTASEVYI